MKIAVPTNDGEMVAEYFGRCEMYVCCNDIGQIVDNFKNTSSHMGGNGLPPEVLEKNGVNIFFCAKIWAPTRLNYALRQRLLYLRM